ncbi:PKD domain-containing protein [Chitinophaga agrisoli]|uniref:PKD domain-containing protein n=2 Tax=Chitinophaga agrisoli TaxID=2607653 RepID=A0A5B2VP45_9BACT|nr:PKD domain-containing protein [Chitinophaga agrisoli]
MNSTNYSIFNSIFEFIQSRRDRVPYPMKYQIHLCRHWLRQWSIMRLFTCMMFFYLYPTLSTNAQTHHVDFDASKWSGCEPLAVQFTNHAESGWTSLNWSFGVGADVADPDPGRIFNTPGVYTVTLTATYPDGVVKVDKTVTVYKKPTPVFTTSATSGCAPLPVTFTDKSTPGDGAIASVTWDFGDGINGTGSPATHTYTLGGNQVASIIVINSFGCSAGTTQQITVNDAPRVGFTADKRSSCSPPLTVNFSNTSTIISNAAMTYLWDFGDGTTSTTASPQHVYTKQGTFNVTLTATAPGGCKQTLSAPTYIQVMKMVPDFALDGKACAKTEVNLVNNTKPAPVSALWEFPDGSVHNGVNTSFTFDQPGDYTIRMTAIGTDCQETVTKTIHINPLPPVKFTVSPNPDCHVPSKTQFTAQTTDATTWAWTFGDGSTSTGKNPLHSYTTEGYFPVKLQATNSFGCSDTATGLVQIQVPTVNFTMSTNGGCIPFTVNFVPYVTSVDPVVKYSWDFGDGTTSNLMTPSHEYTKEGDYIVTLEVETQAGCKVSATQRIEAGTKVVVDFDVDHYKGCQTDIFHFTNKSVPRGTEWLWIFPQDNSSESAENPNHQFNQIGTHDVTLTVINHGCYNTLTKPLLIEIYPPVARFNVMPDCVNKYDRQFNDASDFGASTGPKSWLWEFGDGTTSTEQNPKHTYLKTGIYWVKLTVDNGSCTSNLTQQVRIIDERPVITADTTNICPGDSVKFSLAGPLDPDLIISYLWTFADGSVSTDREPGFHTFLSPGAYPVTLTIMDLNRCVTTSAPFTITVNGITPDFTVTGDCKDKPFTFTDATTTKFPTRLVSWTWDFGDGSSPDTVTQKPNNYVHTFPDMLTYGVKLTVKDSLGCVASVVKPAIVNKVAVNIVVPGQEACQDKTFNFSNNSTGKSLTYAWSFGDGGTSTDATPQHTYTAVGQYTIKLTVTDIDGCTASQDAPNLITVRNPKAAFNFPTDLAPCPPVLVPFTNSSSDYDNVAWQFGDGSTSPELTPGHAYSRPGSYTVSLRVMTDGGCVDTATRSLTIQGPDGTQKATPTEGCWPLKVSMTAQSSNAVKYLWDFDDGHIVITTTPTTDYQYPKEGIYRPRVILEDAKGCQVPALGDDKIVADRVTARFTIDPKQACDGGYVYFTDKSISITQDSLGLPMTYKWDFGIPDRTDDTANVPTPRFLYDQVGTYPVKLFVTSSYGCTNEITIPTVVPPTPEAAITPIPPLCAGGTVKLQGFDTKQLPGTKWQWKIDPNRVYETVEPPILNFDTPGLTNVILTITNGDGTCPDTASTVIRVAEIPALAPRPAQANICLGQSLELQANVAAGTEVTWTDYAISDPRSPNPRITPSRDTTYHVLAENEAGCTREADVAVTVTQPHVVNASDVSICAGKKVQLHASGATRYKWIPETGLNRADIADPMASPTATTTYQVIGFGDNTCFTDTTAVNVTVNPSPVINAGPDQVVATGSEVHLQLESSPDVTSVQWQPATYLSCTDCLTPLVLPKETMTYHVTATNQYSCVSIDDVNIKLVCLSSSVFLPNTFSPNGDGQNDIFYIRGRGVKNVKVFRIFNRWGELVFERNDINTEDISTGWDGRYKGVLLNPDVFIYYAEMMCDTNETYTLKGNVTLLR